MKYRVKKKWAHGGTTYEVGKVLDIDNDEWAKAKIKEGYIEFEAEEKDDDANEPEDEADDDAKGGTATARRIRAKGGKPAASRAGSRRSADDDDAGDDPDSKTPLHMEDLKYIVDQLMDGKAANADRPNIVVVKDNLEGSKTFGYKSFNEYMADVKKAGMSDGSARERLITRGQKALGSDEYATVEDTIGGFLIPPEYRQDMFKKVFETEFVMNPAMGNATVLNINSTMLKMPVENDVTRTGDVLFGGVQVYRTAERTAMTSSRGKIEQVEWKPEDMTGLAYVTDNMLHHASNLAQILGRWFQTAFQYKRTAEFLFGNGIGQSLGMAHASNGALISQARATTGTISTLDVLNMRDRCYDYENAIWIAGKGTGVLPALATLSINVGTGGAPLMLFDLAKQSGMPSMLAERPIVFSEFGGAIGAVNDLMLMSMPHYVIAYTSRMVNDSSIHVRYESNETAFRFVEQFQGMPWWRTTLTLRNSATVSPFLTLAA